MEEVATFSALQEVYFVAVRGQPRDGWRWHEVSESMDLAPRGQFLRPSISWIAIDSCTVRPPWEIGTGTW